MAQYRFAAVDVITGNVGVDLPLVQVEANRVLNSPGSFQASMPLAGVRGSDGQVSPVLQQAYWDATEEDRCSIAIIRDGTALGEWRITARPSRKNDGSPVQLTGEYISGYFREVIPSWLGTPDLPVGGYPGPLSVPVGPGTDMLQIAYDLVAQAKDPIPSTTAPTGSRGLAITLPSRAGLSSGQLITQTDWATQTNDVLSMVTQIQQLSPGFDWDVDVALVGGQIIRTLTLSYPMRGVNAGVTLLMPEKGGQGGQVTDYEANTGDRRATQIITTGASANAGSALIARSNNTALVAGYPLKQKINSQAAVTDPTMLQSMSDAQADYASSSAIPPTITVLADQFPVLGSYTTGDFMTVNVGTSDNFPDGDSQLVRVIGIKIAPPAAGFETVDLTVALP